MPRDPLEVWKEAVEADMIEGRSARRRFPTPEEMGEQEPAAGNEAQPCEHDWKWIDDWGGDPGVIGGTFDCSRWECQLCGLEDLKREPPRCDHEPEN